MTTTATITVQAALDKADPNEVADLLRLMKLGTMLTPLKRAFTGLTSGTSFDLTAIDGTGETTGPSNPNRLAALIVGTLRVVTGTATGPRQVTDSGGTATTAVAKISDDGKTLTFEAAITAFTIEYVPRPSVDMAKEFEHG